MYERKYRKKWYKKRNRHRDSSSSFKGANPPTIIARRFTKMLNDFVAESDASSRMYTTSKSGCCPRKLKHFKCRSKQKRNVPLYKVHTSLHPNLTDRQLHACRNIASQVHVLSTHNKATHERTILQDPERFKRVVGKEKFFKVVWDSGASISISYNKNDFVSYMPLKSVTVKSVGKLCKVLGEGFILWSFQDETGMLQTIKLPAYHIQQSRVRLLSISSFVKHYQGGKVVVNADRMRITSNDTNPISVYISPDTNLPTSIAFEYTCVPAATEEFHNVISEVHFDNMNLSEPQKELLRWHQRLGHISFNKVKFLMRSGVLANTERTRRLHTRASQLPDPIKCAACLYGKQTRKPTPGPKRNYVPQSIGVLKKDNLFPGQEVSVDHFFCATKGRLLSSRGKTKLNDMHCGGCLFADHASNYIFVQHQTSLSTHSTLKAKEAYEDHCRDFGVVPQKYLTDNATCFTSKGFAEHLSKFRQIIRFASPGGHHGNGHAERSIRTIITIARTMMLHAALHWPDAADSTLWPMAVDYAIYIWNHCPDPSTGLSPHELFTKTKWDQSNFHHLHVWGCPAYILDKTISDGKKIPKWKPRSTRCIFLGRSPRHATSLPLVLNPGTGAITAQYHSVIDDYFTTVSSNSPDQPPDFRSPEWRDIFDKAVIQMNENDDAYTEDISVTENPTEPIAPIVNDTSIPVLPIATQPLQQQSHIDNGTDMSPVRQAFQRHQSHQPLPVLLPPPSSPSQPPPSSPIQSTSSPIANINEEVDPISENIATSSSPTSTSDPPTSSAPVQPSNVASTSSSTTLRRSTRKTSVPLTLGNDPVWAPKLSLALQSDPDAFST